MPARWASADPAALLAAALVRPSRKTADAAVAAFADVALGGATCDNALPAADFDVFPVELLERTEEEFFAALLPVIFVAILHLPKKRNEASEHQSSSTVCYGSRIVCKSLMNIPNN
jgi:hypothetical protein